MQGSYDPKDVAVVIRTSDAVEGADFTSSIVRLGVGVSTPKAHGYCPASEHLSSTQKQDLCDMDKTISKITSSKKEALAFLIEVGILNSAGNLDNIYQTHLLCVRKEDETDAEYEQRIIEAKKGVY